MTTTQQAYWDDFYSGTGRRQVPEEPSAFATWARRKIPPRSLIWEFGFGTARDSLWFASLGHTVRGFDFAKSAVAAAESQVMDRGGDATFHLLDLYDEDATRTFRDEAGSSRSPFIYGRFLIHSLHDEGRENFLNLVAHTIGDGQLMLEFRTGADANAPHVFGDDHYRRFLSPETLVEEIEDRGGRVVERVEGHSLAVYKTEDPHVCRLTAKWPQEPGRATA